MRSLIQEVRRHAVVVVEEEEERDLLPALEQNLPALRPGPWRASKRARTSAARARHDRRPRPGKT